MNLNDVKSFLFFSLLFTKNRDYFYRKRIVLYCACCIDRKIRYMKDSRKKKKRLTVLIITLLTIK